MTLSLLFAGVLLLLQHPDWDQIRAGCTESVITSDDPALATLCRGVAHLNKDEWNEAQGEFEIGKIEFSEDPRFTLPSNTCISQRTI